MPTLYFARISKKMSLFFWERLVSEKEQKCAKYTYFKEHRLVIFSCKGDMPETSLHTV